jgi:hypothetical protein
LENENRKSFFEFKLFIFAHMIVGIRHRRTLEFVSSPSLLSKVSNFGIRLPGSGGTRRIPADQILAKLARIWPNLPDFDHTGWVMAFWLEFGLLESGDGGWIPFFAIVIFSYEPNAGKYFQENHFFLKNKFIENILRWKLFYVETNGT